MGMPTKNDDYVQIGRLVLRARGGDTSARIELFERFRLPLHRMVALRLDRRLQGRLDPSDVLQEAFIHYSSRIEECVDKRPEYFFVWLRTLAAQTLVDLHREHLGTQKREVTQEVSLFRGALPEASTDSLAQHLLGRLTSPSNAAVRAELQVRLQEVLNSLDPIDREILTLRHFEELSNGEVAATLQLSKTAASNRYVRALDRLREALSGIAGFEGG
jgi:RNA polymerase sigma-70 factor (ECF subfamily)